ncbi:MAG: hypothetical protein ABIR78_02900 [Ferruginibacter sp.]
MKQFILKHKAALTGTIALLLVGGITMSFQDSPFSYNKYLVEENFDSPGTCTDTLPEKDGSMKMKDFDKLQSQLDGSLLEVTDQLKKIDLTKLKKEIDESLKDVDMDKIKKDVELALKSIDMDKMMAGVKSSLKDLNKEYINADVEKALAEAATEIDKAKLQIKDIDKELIQKELETARKEVEKSKVEIDKIDFDKIMLEARAGIDKAKEELKLTKDMFVEMEKDGLVNAKNGFTIEYKDKYLYIDGKKQSERITDKYRKYFKNDHFKMTIEKD